MQPTEIIRAAKRKLETVERDGKVARKITVSRAYDTTIEDAWNALTTRERIERWFLPIEGELKLGGRYQFKGNAGGTILTCAPPRHVAVTWEMRGDVSWVDVFLESVTKQQTRLTLEHVAVVENKFWDQFGPGAVGVGWDLGLYGFQLYFEKGGAADVTAEGQAWVASDEGKRVVGLSSDAWVEASIAAGTDPAKARVAGATTTQFYTGEGG